MLSSPPTPTIAPPPTPISVSTSTAAASVCGGGGDQVITPTSSSSSNHNSHHHPHHHHLLNPATPSDLMVVTTTTSSSCSTSNTPSPSSSSAGDHHHPHHPHHSHHPHHHHHRHHHHSGQISPPSPPPPPHHPQSSQPPPLTPLQQNGHNILLPTGSLGAVCAGCGQPITDRWLMSIGDWCWHERCLTCAVCRHLLTSSCYVRERTLYCKHDYIKLYSVKCNGCFRSIGPSELVMRVAGGAIYHTDCFTCGRCGRHLTKGDEFALRRGGLLCRRDLDACLLDVSLSGGNSVGGNGVSIAGAVEPNSPDGCAAGENIGNGNGRGPISPNGGGADLGAMMGDSGPTVEHCGQLEAAGNYSPRTSCEIVLGVANIKSEIANTNSSSSPYSPSNSNNGGGGQQGSQQQSQQSVQPPPNVKPDGRRGPKRPRTILTTAQRRAFKASFEISQKPCRKVRETLAKETGLSVRIVQVWFQNQRAKLKKIQRKQQQAALVHGGGGGNGGGGGGNGSHGGGGGNGNGFLNGSESGTGMGSAHSSDKSKDDSTDDEDDDCSSQANTAFGSVSGNTTGNMQSMAGYGMLQSPDGSYYSTGREDDSTGGGGGGGGNGGNYMMTSGAKSDLGALDDSETSLCELDDGNGILVRPNSTGVPPLHGGGNFGPGGGPGATSMMSPLELTCLTGGGVGQPSMFSPNITGNMIMPFGGGVGGGLPLPPQQLGPNHLLTTSSSVSESSLTPIDKLYSMQNSYFSSSSTGGNPQEQECL